MANFICPRCGRGKASLFPELEPPCTACGQRWETIEDPEEQVSALVEVGGPIFDACETVDPILVECLKARAVKGGGA